MAQQIPSNPSAGTLSTKDGDFNGLPAYTNFGAINIAGTFTNLRNAEFTNDRNITSDNLSDFTNEGTVNNNGSIALTGTTARKTSLSNLNKFYNNSGAILDLSNAWYTETNGLIINDENATIVLSGNFAQLGGTFKNEGSVNGGDISQIYEGAKLINSGTFGDSSGDNTTLNNAGYFENQSSGIYYTNAAENDATLKNYGNITHTGNFSFLNSKQFINKSGSIASFEVLVNSAGGEINNVKGGTLVNRGTITNSSNATITNDGLIQSSGSIFNNFGLIQGTGSTAGTINNQGTITGGGNSTGGYLIDGNLLHNDGGNNIFELGGTDDASRDRKKTKHDFIDVDGNLNINGGSLKVSLIDDFRLQRDQEFIITEVGGKLNGRYKGLDEGDSVGRFANSDGGKSKLYISYKAGDGNDISLSTNRPIDDVHQANTKPPVGSSLLFGALADSGKIKQRKNGSYRMVLRGIDEIDWFTDRPNRVEGIWKPQKLLRKWDKYFGSSEPNAQAGFKAEEEQELVTFEMFKPKLKSGKMIFDIRSIGDSGEVKLAGLKDKKMSDMSLFIDDGSPTKPACLPNCLEKNLSSQNLSGLDLSSSNLSLADFDMANLTDANLIGANLRRSSLISANLIGANLSHANLTNTNFAAANLTGANLANADLQNALLDDYYPETLEEGPVNTYDMMFKSTDLTGANLSDANLYRASFNKAIAKSSNLQDADLTDSFLHLADFSKANLSGTNLYTVQLVNTNLNGADLSNANLTKASLNSADLTNANLRGANFFHTQLLNTNLNGADLSNADMTGALCKLEGSGKPSFTYEGTIWNNTTCPDGTKNIGNNPCSVEQLVQISRPDLCPDGSIQGSLPCSQVQELTPIINDTLFGGVNYQ